MDEKQFRKKMIQLRALAKRQGESISKEQVHSEFLPLDIKEEHFLLIFKYLTDEKIRLFDTEEERLRESGKNDCRVNKEDSDYLKMYIDELNSRETVSEEERVSRINKALKNKDTAALVLPDLYLKSVVDTARLYTGQGIAIEDLIGEGNIGVLTAVNMLEICETPREVDEFVMKMIMDSMESLIMDKYDKDEFDTTIAKRVNELNDKAKEMAEDLERLITVEELSKELDSDEDYIRETIRLSGDSIEYIKKD
ncbi:MAG: hypothetical protein K6E98_04850 [Lachnospiraceae bacterium]|nr:hypothetical protein [Lachnospiraceae bacterium]